MSKIEYSSVSVMEIEFSFKFRTYCSAFNNLSPILTFSDVGITLRALNSYTLLKFILNVSVISTVKSVDCPLMIEENAKSKKTGICWITDFGKG